MTVTIDTRRDITLEAVHAVAWRGDTVTLSEAARTRMGSPGRFANGSTRRRETPIGRGAAVL